MVAHTFNLRIREAEAGESVWVQRQLGLQSEFQIARADTQKNPVSKNQIKTTKQNKKLGLLFNSESARDVSGK